MRTKLVEQTIIHFSIGSAATGVHCSIDANLDDPDLDAKIDKVFDVWSRSEVIKDKYKYVIKKV